MSKKCIEIENSSDQNGYVADHADFDLGNTATFETWFAPNSLPTLGVLSGKWKTSGNQRSYGFRLYNDSGDIKMQIYTDSNGSAGGATVATSDVITVNLKEWNHFAFVIDGGVAKFYHGTIDSDDVAVGSGTSLDTPYSGSGEFVIGSERTDGTDGADGKFALARLWKGEARTLSEINTNRKTLLGTTTNLSGEWAFNGDADDNSGNNHDLTLSNSPSYANDSPFDDISLYGSVEGTDYVKMTINASEVDDTLTDFPVFLDLSQIDSADNFWSVVASDGDDIRITNADGTVQYAVEVVAIDTTAKTGEVHFLLKGSLSDSVDTDFRVYYDGSTEKRDDDATYGTNDVWRDDYHFVLHGDFSTGTTLKESSGNASFTTSGSPTSATGKIGKAVAPNSAKFNTTFDSRAEIGTDDVTVQVLTKFSANSNRRNIITFIDDGDSDFHDAFTLQAGNNGGDGSDINLAVRESTSGYAEASDGGGNQDGAWHKIDASRAGTTGKIYADGVLEQTTTNAEMGVNVGALTRISGAQASAQPIVAGEIDEIRARKSELAVDWLTTEKNNWFTPGDFFTYNSPPSGGGGSKLKALIY